jgi:hypothetical protein
MFKHDQKRRFNTSFPSYTSSFDEPSHAFSQFINTNLSPSSSHSATSYPYDISYDMSSPFPSGYTSSAMMQPSDIVPRYYLSDQRDVGDLDPSQTQNMSTDPDDCWRGSPVAKVNPEHEGATNYLNMKVFPMAQEVLEDRYRDEDTYFRDAQMSADYRSQLGAPQPVDQSLPRTDAQKRACVKLMFKAFKSISHATDNEGMIAPFLAQRHNNQRVEAMCWDLLMAIIRRCENGPLLKAYKPEKASRNHKINTFAERLDAVVRALLTQKTICKHLLDAPFINSFVDDPKKSSERVTLNRSLNKQKGEIMAKGKAVSKTEAPPKSPKRKRTKQINSDGDFESLSTADGISPHVPELSARVKVETMPRGKSRSAPPTLTSSSSGSFVNLPMMANNEVTAYPIDYLPSAYSPPQPGSVNRNGYPISQFGLPSLTCHPSLPTTNTTSNCAFSCLECNNKSPFTQQGDVWNASSYYNGPAASQSDVLSCDTLDCTSSMWKRQ